MMTEEQRRFEQWAAGIYDTRLLKDEKGNYRGHVLQQLWQAWQAALTQPARPDLKLPDCPFPCGWREILRLAMNDGAFLAKDLVEGEQVTEFHRRSALTNTDRLIQVVTAVLSFAPHTAPIEPICATGGAEWVKVSEGLPKRGQRVNAFYLNRLGKGRTIRAEYIYSKTEEAGECDPDTQCVEYCEESDTYFVTEGWYEVMDNWEEYGSIAVTEGNITHWMPLPEAPAS